MAHSPLRSCALLLAILAIFGSVAPASAAEATLDVVEVRIDAYPRVVVRLNAIADDVPLDGLAPGYLRVFEDGQPQPSADMFKIRNPDTVTSVALVLDVSGSMAEEDRLPQARAAAKGFLSEMRPRDRSALVTFASEVVIRQPFTTDRRSIYRAIDSSAAAGNTRLYDAIVRSVPQVAALSGGTRALIVLTDGEDTESTSDVSEGIALATRSAIPIYTIGLGSAVQADVLQRIANETGGRFHHAPGPQDLARVFRLISRQLATQYEVFWVSRADGDPGRRVPVTITLSGPALSGAEANLSYRLPDLTRPPSLPASVTSGALTMLPGVNAPSEEQLLSAALLGALAVVAVYAGLVYRVVSRRWQSRLAAFVAGQWNVESSPSSGGSVMARRGGALPVTAASASIAARLLRKAQLERLRSNLIQAGLRSERHFQSFLAALVILPIVLASGGYFLLRTSGANLSFTMVLMFLLALFGLGCYAPWVWLKRRVRKRRKAISRALPDALDLLTIGVSAGLSLDGAMLEVIQKWTNELTEEFTLVLNEMRAGTGRRQALLNLVERTQLEDIRLLVASLIQADELGTGIADTLRIQAEQLRIRRRQAAEELARKAPIKMLFPLVFLIFPSLFVVILAPAMIQLMRSFKGLGY
jgi:tight adherence protein C